MNQSIIITKTVPILSASGTIVGHEIDYTGFEGKALAELWWKDPVSGYFYQKSGYTDFSSGVMQTAIWQLPYTDYTQKGYWELAFLFQDGSHSNVFSCILKTVEVDSGFQNLGPAPSIFSVAQAYDSGALTGATGKKKH